MNVLEADVRQFTVTAEIRDDAAGLLHEARDRSLGKVTITLDDGQVVSVRPGLSRFIVNLIASAASGAELSTHSLPDELTTTVAAGLIGVSRPTLMKMIARGDLPFTKAGTHTRLRRQDVLAYRQERQQQQATAVAELMEAGADLEG